MLWKSLMDNRVIDCYIELKRLRDLQFESDFNDGHEASNFYREKAEYIQSLINKGTEHIPNF